ncbi:hypothetical protein EV424DRAFT_1345478 [Suillus variegatus]|nr:hypothetical protein EV424DRAFT_1345478 [Suillus variegatus]
MSQMGWEKYFNLIGILLRVTESSILSRKDSCAILIGSSPLMSCFLCKGGFVDPYSHTLVAHLDNNMETLKNWYIQEIIGYWFGLCHLKQVTSAKGIKTLLEVVLALEYSVYAYVTLVYILKL